jgi:hypothetical protein
MQHQNMRDAKGRWPDEDSFNACTLYVPRMDTDI